ncbi:MAG: DUF5683 domain-containing protein [Balneolaceae bacterium]|nr:DUF5683 domain-containing protein [Balneolaceae bacterium]
MIKAFTSNIVILLAAVQLTCAQPLKQNLPFSWKATEHNPEQTISILEENFAYQPAESSSKFAPIRAMQTQPGYAFLGSAIIPGLGQAANKKWWRAGAYLVADAIFLALHISNQNRAEELQQGYEQFADNNWSVVTYSKWLVEYHKQNGIYQDNAFINELEEQVEGVDPTYSTSQDWGVVEIQLLRNVEKDTPFISSDGTVGNIFSHTMPDYGSQQYYELISKYYQYGPGWNDFGVNRQAKPLDSIYQLAWNGSDMPPHFLEGARLADRFNNKYRIAGNMLSYMILNHVVSAFDAFITVKLKNNRLETETNFFGSRQFILKYRF